MTNKLTDKISVHDFYFETPLYDSVNVEDLDGNIYEGTVDGYSCFDKRDTTYSIHKSALRHNYTYYDGVIGVRLRDKRTDSGDLFFFLFESGDQIVKIGQAPSLVALQYSDISSKYKDVLSDNDLFMLKRAIGLAAHGTGIGSYVYLRRIFESLIWETYETNKSALDLPESDFKAKRMKDKIQSLKRYLPANMTKFTPLYGILSKGIHELSEKECLAYFDTMKLAIELILKQKIQQKQEADEEAETIKRLEEATTRLSKNTGETDD